MKRISGPRTALIQMLVEEHRHIKTGLSLLDAMRKRIADRRTIPFGDIATLVRFFREYADKIHHRSEEELLFPEDPLFFPLAEDVTRP